MTSDSEKIGRVGGVDLWRLHLDLPDAELRQRWSDLSTAERERADQLSRPEVRRRFIAARSGLRRVLASYLSVPPRSLEFFKGPQGKPALPGGPEFNLSHSDDLALCAVAHGRQVGIDLERLRCIPERDDIARQWFREEEREAYHAESASRDSAFLRLWTRREAYLKAIGTGLAGLEASSAIDPERWEVHDLRPFDGYVGALVVERNLGS
jgi:4'-phosphopantetheinyl transferase